MGLLDHFRAQALTRQQKAGRSARLAFILVPQARPPPEPDAYAGRPAKYWGLVVVMVSVVVSSSHNE